MLKRPPKSVQVLLQKGTLAQLNEQHHRQINLQNLWREAVPADLAVNSRCVAIQGQTLIIYVRSGAWATRVRLLQAKIMQTFQAATQTTLRSLEIKVKPSLQ